MDEIVGAKGILTEPSPQENDMTPIRKIGIIGSGQMGNGIAHVIALAGYDVVLTDLTKEKVDKAIELIDRNLTRQVASGKITEEDRKQALSRITYAENYQGLSDADLVIEAATEDETVKRKIFVALCPFLKPEAIVATNTSSISITRLAAATDRPERFIGLHFMNPVPVMELVEMIRGIATEDVTFAKAREFVGTLGKTTAVSEDFPAFMVNRILLPMINEAVYTLYEGVGSVDAIDTAMRLGAHHPMGPLQLADFIGLDTCLSIMQVLYEGLAEFQIPALSALGEICRGRLARAQDQARLLRLSRRKADADALGQAIGATPKRLARPQGPSRRLLRQDDDLAFHRRLVRIALDLDDARFLRLEVDRVHVAALQRKLLVDAVTFEVNVVRHSLHPDKMQPDRLAGFDHDLRGLEGEGADAPLALGVRLAEDEAAAIGQRC